MDYEVRSLTPADAGDFFKLRLAALAEEPAAFASSVEEEVGATLGEIAERITAGPDRFVLGAFADERRLVGCVGFGRECFRKMRHRGFLWGMYVAPEFRRRGLARTLLQAALQRAAEVSGLSRINLTVASENAAAVRLYRSFGFVTFGLEPEAMRIGDRFIAEEHMSCRLPA